MDIKRVLIILMLSSWFFTNAQDFTLKGQLKNAETGKPVPYASVWIKNTTYGIASNDEGKFELPLPEKFLEDSLFISSLGFKTYKEKVKKLAGKDFLNISLEETTYRLDEITIKSISPETILLTSLKRVPYQFGGDGPLELEYFYRSVTRENDRYAYFIESAFRLIAKPDKKDAIGSYKLDYRAVRQSNNYKRSPLSRPFVTPVVIFKFKIPINYTDSLIRLVNKKAWIFDLDYTSHDDELVYIIKANIDPSRHPGDMPIRGRDFIGNLVFYIRAKDYTILRIDYGLGEFYKRIQPERIPSHLKLVAQEDGTIIFREMQGRFYPHYYQVIIDYTWHDNKTGKLISNGVEKNEAIVQERNILSQKNLPLIKARQDYSIPNMNYDSAFWSSYILKDQIPLHPHVLKDLENHHNISIDDQFYANTTTNWWTPKGLKKAYKKFETSPPKPSLDGNVSFDLDGFKDAKFVSVAGDFNGWNPIQFFLQKNETGWSGKIDLNPGVYEYKFMVDGKWITDPANVQTTHGKTKNSVVTVK